MHRSALRAVPGQRSHEGDRSGLLPAVAPGDGAGPSLEALQKRFSGTTTASDSCLDSTDVPPNGLPPETLTPARRFSVRGGSIRPDVHQIKTLLKSLSEYNVCRTCGATPGVCTCSRSPSRGQRLRREAREGPPGEGVFDRSGFSAPLTAFPAYAIALPVVSRSVSSGRSALSAGAGQRN